MQLGAGGNGEVWEALDEDTGEVAAISGLLWRDGYSRLLSVLSTLTFAVVC